MKQCRLESICLYLSSCQYQSQQGVDIILLNSITEFTREIRDSGKMETESHPVWNNVAQLSRSLAPSFRCSAEDKDIISFSPVRLRASETRREQMCLRPQMSHTKLGGVEARWG